MLGEAEDVAEELPTSGGDVGALDEPPVEEVPAAAEPAAGAEASPAE